MSASACVDLCVSYIQIGVQRFNGAKSPCVRSGPGMLIGSVSRHGAAVTPVRMNLSLFYNYC